MSRPSVSVNKKNTFTFLDVMSDAADYSRKEEKHIYRFKRDLQRFLPEF